MDLANRQHPGTANNDRNIVYENNQTKKQMNHWKRFICFPNGERAYL